MKTIILLLMFCLASITQAGVISVAVKNAFRQSHRLMTPVSRRAAEQALTKACKLYGDDALKAVSKGGLEALEQGAKHGPEFWKFCSHASPKAARCLALHADDLMPLARRVGPEVLELEAKVPGLGQKVVANFGDDAARKLAAAPPADISKLCGLAQRADSPATRNLLYDAYRKTQGDVLRHLDAKHILAYGLSGAAITTALGLSSGAKALAEKHPAIFENVLNKLTLPVRIVMFVIGGWLCYLLWRIGNWLMPKKKSSSNAATAQTKL